MYYNTQYVVQLVVSRFKQAKCCRDIYQQQGDYVMFHHSIPSTDSINFIIAKFCLMIMVNPDSWLREAAK